MIKFIKRQWLRFKQSWLAFKREWRFNKYDFSGQILKDKDFQIIGLFNYTLKSKKQFPDENFNLKPPYYGQAIMRIDGHVFTLKHKHYNPTTGDVRYLDTDKPKDGYMVQDLNWYHDNLNQET
jgi:hypothetical protein